MTISPSGSSRRKRRAAVLGTAPLFYEDWLRAVRGEYLSAYVPAGGSSVKIAVMDAGEIDLAAVRLEAVGQAAGLITVRIDAARTRVHMMNELFFEIARLLPWDVLLQRYLEGVFAQHAYPWPQPGTAMTVAGLASAFGIAPAIMGRHVDQWLSTAVWDDRLLAQDFRAAMLALCLDRLEPPGGGPVAPVVQWLRGEKVPKGLLRGVDISARLTRTNARPMLASLCHFLRKAGAAGLMLVLDGRQLTLAASAVLAGTLKYTPSSVMDTYEVLREIIDDAERLPGLFVAVLADEAIATGDARRTLAQYAALQMRVWPDVRPGDRQNPVAPLVWIGA
jgi:hypothetical protein